MKAPSFTVCERFPKKDANHGRSELVVELPGSQRLHLRLEMGRTPPCSVCTRTPEQGKSLAPSCKLHLKSVGGEHEKSKVPILKAYLQVIGHKKGMGARILPWGDMYQCKNFQPMPGPLGLTANDSSIVKDVVAGFLARSLPTY